MSGSLPTLILLAVVSLSSCVRDACEFHSQCGAGFYCEFGRCDQDCREDFDCADGLECSEIGRCVGDAVDGGMPPPSFDAGAPPPPSDAGGNPGLDAGDRSLGQYLDRCRDAADCASGHCVGDVGGIRSCSISCTAHADCISEHVCGPDGVCVPDDTGRTCARAADCTLSLCAGNPAAGAGHCTRPCATASECPAGYACADAGGAFVCVHVEKPCSSAAECATGLCLNMGLGCTTACRSVADCPVRFGFLPPYTCQSLDGTPPLCIPPDDVSGADAIGVTCAVDGINTCRSGVCDAAAAAGPMCTQACSEEGGCPSGFGCQPIPDDSDGDGAVDTIFLLCALAGPQPLGAPCSADADCASSFCLPGRNECTRLCTSDEVCPTGTSCREFAPGLPYRACA